MPAMLERVPTLSHRIHQEPAGPKITRPFGLDALTNPVTIDNRRPLITVDPATQLSVVDGQLVVENPTMANTSCTTESDGADAIALDTDTNDD
ncbi:hypothetical protein [Nocardioides speluncae]|uniref:hypothetical protein n=1 Tax=Nocardioides speluncae TaxID=2670337 RepID=UPI0012B17B5A|nr:hypothetical protein [Nocardioides speluncae]